MKALFGNLGCGRTVQMSTASRVILASTAMAVIGGLVSQAAAQDRRKSRAVVVSPDPRGTEVPVAPNERVGAVTVVNVNGNPVAVVRIDQMPNKPDFNIITPAGISHPYNYSEDGPAGTTITSSAIWVHGQGGNGYWAVRREVKRGGRVIGHTTKRFPQGSQLVPDPPQPPGTFFTCPDAMPTMPDEEAIVLAELGIPDEPETQVWAVPSTEFLFFHDEWFDEPEIVKIGSSLGNAGGSPGALTPTSIKPLPYWTEDFEPYEIDSGLHSLGGWKGWDNDPAFDAVVTDVQARTGSQSVDIAGQADLVQELSRHSTSGSLSMSAWQYIPSDFASGGDDQFAGSYFVLLNTYNDGGPYDWSVQMQFDSNDEMLKVFHGDGLNTIQVPYETDRWVKIEAIVDLENDWTQVYYDDTLITEYSWTGGVLGGGGGAPDVAAVDLYAGGSSPIFYDDLVLEPLPK